MKGCSCPRHSPTPQQGAPYVFARRGPPDGCCPARSAKASCQHLSGRVPASSRLAAPSPAAPAMPGGGGRPKTQQQCPATMVAPAGASGVVLTRATDQPSNRVAGYIGGRARPPPQRGGRAADRFGVSRPPSGNAMGGVVPATILSDRMRWGGEQRWLLWAFARAFARVV